MHEFYVGLCCFLWDCGVVHLAEGMGGLGGLDGGWIGCLLGREDVGGNSRYGGFLVILQRRVSLESHSESLFCALTSPWRGFYLYPAASSQYLLDF